LNDPAVRSIMDRIDVGADPALDEGFPDRRPAVAVFTLRDGQVINSRIELARGEPESPLGPEDVRRKFHALATRVMTQGQAHELCGLVENLDEVPNVAVLARLMTAANR
jgi:2-methylcitrate dehydratase PrpD